MINPYNCIKYKVIQSGQVMRNPHHLPIFGTYPISSHIPTIAIFVALISFIPFNPHFLLDHSTVRNLGPIWDGDQ